MDGGAIDIAGAAASEPYPGSETTSEDLLLHADGFREAALTLLGERGAPGRRKRSAGRLCAIHAIELYLNAFLSRNGRGHVSLRQYQHQLAQRTAAAQGHGLQLRPKTSQHMAQLDALREYVVVRYAPERAMTLTQVNRLIASLEETAREVRAGLRLLPPRD